MTFSIGTISHGTLRHQDMLISFAEAYQQNGGSDRQLFVGAKALALFMENREPSPADYEVAGEILDDLIVKLEEIAAANGCYFGATEGDASDFGFWPNDGGEAEPDKRAFLEGRGWTVGDRNPQLNTNHPGIYMAVEPFEEWQLPTEDGSNGPWCIVGDDLDALIDQAYRFVTELEA